MSSDPDRRDFAAITAQAYADQFHPNDLYRRRVRNEPIITYEPHYGFGSQSSLTPVAEDEVVVMTLEQGIFGDPPGRGLRRSIESYLRDSASDYLWEQVLDNIDEFNLDKKDSE